MNEPTVDPPPAPRGSAIGALLRTPIALPLAAGLFVILHVGFGHEDFGLSARIGAATMGLLAFVSLRRARPDRLPFVPYFATYFYILYGLSTVSEQRLTALYGPVHISERARTLAVWACALVMATVMVTATLARPAGRHLGEVVRRVLPPGEVGALRSAIRGWAVVSLAAQVAMTTASRRMLEIDFMLALLAAPALAQALLFSEWRESRSPVSRLWFGGYTVIATAIGLATGALQSFVTPLLTAFLLFWLDRGRIRLAPVLVVVGVGLVFNPAKFEYRRQLWSGDQVSLVDRAALWVGALERTWIGEDTDVEKNLNTTRQRFSEFAPVAQVFDWVPTFVPHSGLARWKMIPYSYMPRALWPEKPLLTHFYNSHYAMTFGLQTREATETTTINIPLVTEAYWSWGWTGIVVASGIVGLLLGLYEGAFFAGQWAMKSIGMMFLVGLPAVSHLAVFCMGIAQRFAVAAGVLWLIVGMAWLLSANRRTV